MSIDAMMVSVSYCGSVATDFLAAATERTSKTAVSSNVFTK